ncbi:MAG: patatin-like phospholipase family protein [Turicibacter sp.]|nr:patatin-like phospholipase family protein [Turicibacter sp.]
MKKIGLAFCGGGAKGAYQVGVIRVLEEFGLLDQVQAVAGSSIGAINGTLFLQYSVDEIEEFWLQCPWSSVFSVSKENMKRMNQVIDAMNSRQLSPFFGMMNLAGMANHVGLPLSRKGFEKVFRYYLNPSMIQTSDVDLFISCAKSKSSERRFFKLNDLSSKEMKNVLLATTAVPGLYEPVNIDGTYYLDPMKQERAPIRPLLATDCDMIIIIYLDARSRLGKPMIEGKRIVEIFPRKELGNGIYGSFDFRPSVLKYYMELGSADAYRVLYRIISENPKPPYRVEHRSKILEP